MRTVSQEFLETYESSKNFYITAEIHFTNPEESVIINKGDIILKGNSVNLGTTESSLPIGQFVSKELNLSIRNDDNRWERYNFYYSTIDVYTNLDLNNGETETFYEGKFTVISPETYGELINIVAIDDCYKFDTPYEFTGTKSIQNYTIPELMSLCCNNCGIKLSSNVVVKEIGSFPALFVMSQVPKDITNRQFIGDCAMLLGGNAYINSYIDIEGNPQIEVDVKYYSDIEFGSELLNGGIFDMGTPKYQSGDLTPDGKNIDGGEFDAGSPYYNTGYRYNGGTFLELSNMPILYDFSSLNLDVNDVVVSGFKMQDTKGDVHKRVGDESYIIEVSNSLVNDSQIGGTTENPNGLIDFLFSRLGGFKVRPFTGDSLSNPLIEFMDYGYIVDRKRNVYQTLFTDIDFTYGGLTVLKCTADSPLRVGKAYSSKANMFAVKVGKQIVENDIGLYAHDNGDGTYLLHDKKNISDSQTQITLTNSAISLSLDGGQSYPYEFKGGGSSPSGQTSSFTLLTTIPTSTGLGGWDISSTPKKYEITTNSSEVNQNALLSCIPQWTTSASSTSELASIRQSEQESWYKITGIRTEDGGKIILECDGDIPTYSIGVLFVKLYNIEVS